MYTTDKCVWHYCWIVIPKALSKYTRSNVYDTYCWIVIPKAFKSRFVYRLRLLCFNKIRRVEDQRQRPVLVLLGIIIFLPLFRLLSAACSWPAPSMNFNQRRCTSPSPSIQLPDWEKQARCVDGLRCVLFDPLQESSDRIGSGSDPVGTEGFFDM